MASNIKTIKKLQMALNTKGYKILYQTSQFYSIQQNRPITKYHVRQSVFDVETHRTVSAELFSSYSQLQVVLFLRDLWCAVNGWDLPNDNEYWNSIRPDFSFIVNEGDD